MNFKAIGNWPNFIYLLYVQNSLIVYYLVIRPHKKHTYSPTHNIIHRRLPTSWCYIERKYAQSLKLIILCMIYGR